MKHQICAECGSVIEVLSEMNRVGEKLLCWNCLVPEPLEQWRLSVTWSGRTPTVKEVSQLRALIPEYQTRSSAELWADLKDKTEVVIGEFYRPHLAQIVSRNVQYGLNLVIESTLDDQPE